MAILKLLIVFLSVTSTLATTKHSFSFVENSHKQKMVCTDMFSATCSRQLGDDPFRDDDEKFEPLRNDSSKWPVAKDPAAQKIIQQTQDCKYQDREDAVQYGVRKDNAQAVLELAVKKICSAAAIDNICSAAAIENCTGMTPLNMDQVVRAALNITRLPILYNYRDKNNNETFTELVPELPKLDGFLWHSAPTSNHAVYLKKTMEKYRKLLLEATSLTEAEVDEVIAFQNDLALIQLPKYRRDQLELKSLCGKDSMWPSFITNACNKQFPLPMYTRDVAFAYALEATVNKHAPTINVLAAMTTFNEYNLRLDIGVLPFPVEDLLPLMFDDVPQCPSELQVLLARRFHYAAQLEQTVGLPYTRGQKVRAQKIVDHVTNAFVARVWHGDTLQERNKRVIAQAAKDLSVQIGLPDMFFNKTWEEVNDRNYSECEMMRIKADYPKFGAFAVPRCNLIVLQQPIVHPPFLDHARAQVTYEVYDYAMMGTVFAHELGHHFDPNNLPHIGKNINENILTAVEKQRFFDAVRCYQHDMEHHCCQGEGADRVCTDPHLNQGEDMSDLLAVHIAIEAYEMSGALSHDLERGIARGELDEETGAEKLRQLFFYANANIWCRGWKSLRESFRGVDDPHSPYECRINTAMRQSGKFTSAFGCDARTDFMARPDGERCDVWN